MTVLQMIGERKGAAPLGIVWRNPHPRRSQPRRHSRERDGQRIHYVLQEFVEYGRFRYWTTISDFEVVAGGRAA